MSRAAHNFPSPHSTIVAEKMVTEKRISQEGGWLCTQ